MTRRLVLVVALGAVLVAAVMLRGRCRSLWAPAHRAIVGRRSVSDALARYGEGARQRFLPRFAAAGVPYPPPRLTLVALKAERRLELWAGKGGGWAFVDAYPNNALYAESEPRTLRLSIGIGSDF